MSAQGILGTGKPQVITTSSVGKVHHFSGAGKKIADLDAACYATMVRVGRPSEKDKSALILVAGTGRAGAGGGKTEILVALTGEGTKKWSLELPGGAMPHADSAQAAPGRPWFAVGMRGGPVHVVDIDKGEILASMNDQGTMPEVGWLT